MQEGTTCRPRRESVASAADAWTHEVMDDDTAADYVTGESEGHLVDGLEPQLEAGGAGDDEVAALRRRIAELEQAASSPPLRAPALRTPDRLASSSQQPVLTNRGVLFGGSPNVNAIPPPPGDVMNKFRSLAGAAPTRLGAHERQARASRPEASLEALQQEAGLGAIEPLELEEGIQELEGVASDPLQRMLLLQMQQMSMLAKRNQARSVDPLTAALAGGGESQSMGSSSSGIKGCAAREAYLKIMQDLPAFASKVNDNACQELGIEMRQAGPGLMKEYVEKRIPLGDNRLLTQSAYLWAWAWEMGYRLNNPELMAVSCRGMLFVDQTAIDFGRTNLSWLLTALPEPQFSIVQRNRVRQSLTPFSRLAAASWIGAMWPS